MSALSGDFYGFDDLFPPDPPVSGLGSGSGEQQRYDVSFKVMENVLIVPDDFSDTIVIVFHEGCQSKTPGAGAYLTVRQATRVITLLQDCIAYIEHGGVAPGDVPGEGEEEGEEGEGEGEEDQGV